MPRGLGWNREQENHAWLVANQKRFDRSHYMAYRVPDEIDGRVSQTIKDQGQLGSCSGFSRSSLEERLNYLATGAKGPTLSAMYCYLTNQQECGCSGGDNGATIAGSVSAAGKEGVLVRMHSRCMYGDVFGSTRCDCQRMIQGSLARIAEEGAGVLVYLHQSGLGARTHHLPPPPQGQAPPLHESGIGAQILADLGLTSIRLLTNHPRKVVGLDAFGIEIVEQVPVL